jgi:CRP/FNR family transcriptional regulator, cyclic AMP receptor protein
MALARQLLGEALGFRGCTTATLDAMVAGGTFRTLGKGELLASRGARFDNLCIVVQGSLETSLLRHDGHRHLISFLQAGDTAGMISLIDGLGHVNDLRAREANTTVMLVPGDKVRQLRLQDPALGLAFELQLAFRSRLLYERLAADPSIPLESRIASLLTTLAGLYGVKCADGVLVSMKISQTDLADWLGVSRQSINVAMQQLRTEKLIQAEYSTITITDPERLAARVDL